MKKKFQGKKVLILGSGGLKIGQAGEFDYSGSQAIKALKEEGIKTVLINPNIATVQTDPLMADEVYLQPLNVDTVTKIIQKEKPDGILLGFGGQTALNLGLKLEEKGILKKYGVEVLGTPLSAIRLTEDRELFKKSLLDAGMKTPISFSASTVKDAVAAAKKIGYPLMIRSGFSLGGLGSGKIEDEEELKKRVQEALSSTPQVLLEEYLYGFKELEYEIVRDSKDQALIICNMENLDPMGIHTGESIVVAPSQTLNNNEYHQLRTLAIQAARLFGIVGECNIQFALSPKDSDYRIIEMNARLSRSSALASKATGYPLAFIAAKLSLGYSLDELTNSVTRKTTAFFEPALDYIVVKIPRWDTQKLKSANRRIGTEMKSVGEVMAIGRSFPEALQKAIRMLNIGADGLDSYPSKILDPEEEIKHPTDRRIFALYEFFKKNGKLEKAHKLSQIDPWFLAHIQEMTLVSKKVAKERLTPDLLLDAKKMGFSDKTLGKMKKTTQDNIRKIRIKEKILPKIKQIDTLAGEFEAQTNYLYLTYHAQESDIDSSKNHPIIVLGSGPYCIGSSVEFDWCAVNMARNLRKNHASAIIINSNPETVSTDFDESDRLYFEELTLERVQDIADFESPKGIIVSVGGQIANNLALPLHSRKYPLLGTSAVAIDTAENRESFSSLLHKLGINQPAWEKVTSLAKAESFAEKVGYPLLIRPSYVLSGAAMNIVTNKASLVKFLQEAALVSPDHPVVMTKFIIEAKELEIDGIAQNGNILISAISEHIENAGVHSGDATIVLPPQKLYLETIRRTKKITQDIVEALSISGPFNIQFIAKDNEIQVIELNVRASRSMPFVSKVTGYNFMEIACEVFLDIYKKKSYNTLELDYVGVKSPQFSYQRLKGADPVAHVEMASTGEVACLSNHFLEAFFSSWLATDAKLKGKRMVVTLVGQHRPKLLPYLKMLEENGWEFFATEGTHDFLSQNGIGSLFIYKVHEKYEPNITTLIKDKKIDLIINIPKDVYTLNGDGFEIRRLAIDHHIPLITNIQLAQTFLQCFSELQYKNLPIKSWREFLNEKRM